MQKIFISDTAGTRPKYVSKRALIRSEFNQYTLTNVATGPVTIILRMI
jgi:hypothetical protein